MLVGLAMVTLFLSGFFSGTEIAFVSSNRLRVELRRKKGSRRGKLLAKYFEKPSEFLGTMLVGNSIALVFFGILSERILVDPVSSWLSGVGDPFSQALSFLIITLITTIVVLLFGEFMPKLLFRLNPSGILFWFAYPIFFIRILLYPFVWVMVKLSYSLISLLMGGKLVENELVFTRKDLEHFIKDAQPDNQEEIDQELFENALYLSNMKVRECMIPRTEIIGMEAKEGVKGLRHLFNETGLSRILIYRDSLDDILGYVHHLQLLHNPETIDDLQIIDMPIVPEVFPARDLMNRLMKRKVNIALVVDEFGGTAGICSLEDILEEIVGDIEDEHDAEILIEEKISDTEYRFSGRLEIDDLNERYELGLPGDEQFHTISGYIVTVTESIPERNERIRIGDFEFIIEEMTETKIETVRMIRTEKTEEDG